MPSLLLENFLFLVYVGIKNRIQIHMHQILEILIIAARNRINCLVAVRHGIKKRIQGTLDKLHKRILHRKILGTAKNGMLYNMRNTCGICWRCAKADVKHLIFIIIAQKRDSCPCFFMA